MRTLLLLMCFLCCAAIVRAQYNNEWIDYSKTYYKCKVGQTGLCRISTGTLSGLGLSAVPAGQFQLWRNGKEVALYTSAASGVLPAGGYLEFYGQMNDGSLDDKLYKNVANHLNTTYSFSTDTSAYFLTVNTNANTLRFADVVNDVQNNTLPAEPYFLYTYQSDFRQKINRGIGFNYGENIYSSTYDIGEFWSTNDIADNQSDTFTMSNLNVAASGPAATIAVTAAGNASGGSNRNLVVSVNNISYINQSLPNYNTGLFTASAIPLSSFNSNNANIVVANQNSDNSQYDYLVVGMVHLTYPHSFNMGGSATFAFALPANTNGNYLEITNFTSNGSTPVLYDVTNNTRYTANTATAGILKFKLMGSNVDRSLVLVSEDASNITQLTSFTTKNFINYGAAANAGDYLIISNQILFAGDNPVEQYRQYRASATGGSYNAKIYDADELIDQFAWGIKKTSAGHQKLFAVCPKCIYRKTEVCFYYR